MLEYHEIIFKIIKVLSKKFIILIETTTNKSNKLQISNSYVITNNNVITANK